MLLVGLFAGKSAVAQFAVKRNGVSGRVSQMLLEGLLTGECSAAWVAEYSHIDEFT